MSQREHKLMDECAVFSRSLSPYLDGELDPDHAVDMESHALSCGECSERVALLRATRQSLKHGVERRCSDALRIRAVSAMHEARAQHAVATPEVFDETALPKLIRLRYAVGLAAAAGIAFAMSVSRHATSIATADGFGGAPRATAASTATGFDLLDDLVSLHAAPLPPEITNPEELVRWDPLVGVPVRGPSFKPFNASFNGARVHSVIDRRAALLQYTVQGHRVTVYVFNPRVMSVQTMPLEARVVHRHPVYVGSVRGYSIAAAEQSGIGYALASDFGADKSTDLVLNAAAQQGVIQQ
jgi:anti-sigma factor RsiW